MSNRCVNINSVRSCYSILYPMLFFWKSYDARLYFSSRRQTLLFCTQVFSLIIYVELTVCILWTRPYEVFKLAICVIWNDYRVLRPIQIRGVLQSSVQVVCSVTQHCILPECRTISLGNDTAVWYFSISKYFT